MSDKETLIRVRLKELAAYRDENNKGLTQQMMADKLNTEGIPSLSGQPWSKYSIRRILKKLDQPAAAPAIRHKQPAAKSPPPAKPARSEEDEHKLEPTSPLMQWYYFESIRGVVENLLKQHVPENLVDQLNAMGVPTADGSPWSQAAVSRVLRVLQPTNAAQVRDDMIRQQIKAGQYDTEDESFKCVTKKPDKPGKRKAKQKLPEPIEQKKKKKRKKKNKKK